MAKFKKGDLVRTVSLTLSNTNNIMTDAHKRGEILECCSDYTGRKLTCTSPYLREAYETGRASRDWWYYHEDDLMLAHIDQKELTEKRNKKEITDAQFLTMMSIGKG